MNRQCAPFILNRHLPFLALLLLALALQPADLRAQSGDRDQWQRVPDVIAALAIGTGSQVADIGAGNGYFTTHLARHVGSSGAVFAVEISEGELSRLRRLAEDAGLAIDRPGFEAAADHEMTEHDAMLAGMRRALRPGGRLVIIDLVPNDGSASRDRQTDSHRISIDLVEREVRAAGFEVLESDAHFTSTGRGTGQWMLVARRPARSGSGA